MIRKHKKFSWPRKLYDATRIADENKLLAQYGLKNKREIWKTEAKVRYYRNRAKKLISAQADEQKAFFNKISEIGLTANNVADVLALTKEDLFKRRLSYLLVKKNFASTQGQARQLVTHRRVSISGHIINSPGYIVRVDQEKHIEVRQVKQVHNKADDAENESNE